MLKSYSRTGAALAIAANVPVVPIVHNAGVLWPRGPWIRKPGEIKIIIGTPVEATNKNAKQLTKQIENWTIEHYALLEG